MAGMNLHVELKAIADSHDEGEKRQYFPYEMTWVCPRCGAEQYRSFQSDYLSYPTFGKPYKLETYCDDCDKNAKHRVTIELIPRLTLELVAPEPPTTHAPVDGPDREDP